MCLCGRFLCVAAWAAGGRRAAHPPPPPFSGESLLNDASSFTLFTIFLSIVKSLGSPGGAGSAGAVIADVVVSTLKLGFGGLAVGLAFGAAAHLVLKFMRRFSAPIDQQAGGQGGWVGVDV